MDIRFPNGRLLALTLSYDDGVQQDEKLISILNAHGIRATFNLNSGLFAPEGTVFPKGQIHRRLTESQVKALYDVSVHEVAVHCLTHRSLPEIPAPRMIHEIMEDRIRLEDLFGVIVRGSAYPFGTFNDTAVEALDLCGIAYCRTVISSHDFRLPSDWLRLEPTCHHDDPMLDELCDRFLASSRPSLFYLWGHAYEFEAHDNWDRIEQFCSRSLSSPGSFRRWETGIQSQQSHTLDRGKQADFLSASRGEPCVRITQGIQIKRPRISAWPF